MTTLKSDLDRVEQLKVEVARITQENKTCSERLVAAIKEH